MALNLRNLITSLFKINGLSIRSDGSKELCELLEPIDSSEHEEWIEKVIESIQKLPINTSLVSRDIIQQAAQEVSASENEDLDALLQCIEINNIPKLTYNIERRKFVVNQPGVISLHGEANCKASLFTDRYSTVFQRISNHELFRPPAAGTSDPYEKRFGLVKVEFLLGISGREDDVVILGLLVQLVEGSYHLEDDTGTVKLDLSKATFHTGLFTYNCLILVEGHYEDKILVAKAIGLPPGEPSNTTRALLGNVNYFGASGNGCAKYDVKLQKAERENQDAMIVMLSDVWLDKIKVMDKLRQLFSGYSQFPPTAFIFCGNFLSESHGSQQVSDLRVAMSTLGDMLNEHPTLVKNSKFIFIPGPNDPGPGNIYPRPPLPKFVRKDLEKKVANCEFVSNPCRMLYCTQEIVIFREDIMTKMCRNCVYFPTNSDDIPSHFAKTLVSQSHLSPVPLHVIPVYWALDHCLSLHPTPDVIITADKGEPFTTSHNNCTIINPGSFFKTDFSFKVYLPTQRTVEDSQVADE